MIVKISAAAESGRLCELRLTSARQDALAIEKRETDLKNLEIDLAKERDESAVVSRQRPTAASQAEVVAARATNAAAIAKISNLRSEMTALANQRATLKKEVDGSIACVTTAQKTLTGLFIH